VGVIGIDRALSTGDFRSYERTFSLITQVVGRSGRADRPGQALIQTTQPDHYIIELGAKQDYKGFYEQEIAIRRTMLYPPFCDICVVGISSVTEREAATAANIFEALLREAHSGAEKIPLVIYRATKCDMERVCGQYRYKIMLKCKNDRRFREFISNVRRDALKMKEFSDVNMYVDINGDIP
ncbi:MAG: primosomal protein N', partial [Oscillospiraceae bacterium]|nr:primosomal protein N' [Oscillospiraceae bacterium]